LLISHLTYAIGDVHGRSDLLEALLDFIQLDADKRRQEPKVIFLGDIVDRGPESKRCVELVISTLNRWPKSKLVLGNHDDWFLRVLGTDDPEQAIVDAWIRNGGLPTICNYDYEPDLGLARIAVKTECQHHLTVFERASLIEVDGPFLFVHAGIHPDRAIHEQERTDCLTIRKPFLEHTAAFSHVVVHGHTITESCRPVVTSNRIALDTGAYRTGHLTALVIDPVARSVEFAWTTQTDHNISVEWADPVVTALPEALNGCSIRAA
jgi:serine/threonine protein phosphatase 1